MTVRVVPGVVFGIHRADILVCPVSLKPAAPGPLADEFRARYPLYAAHYQRYASAGKMVVGNIHSYFTDKEHPSIIVTLPIADVNDNLVAHADMARGLRAIRLFALQVGPECKRIAIPFFRWNNDFDAEVVPTITDVFDFGRADRFEVSVVYPRG